MRIYSDLDLVTAEALRTGVLDGLGPPGSRRRCRCWSTRPVGPTTSSRHGCPGGAIQRAIDELGAALAELRPDAGAAAPARLHPRSPTLGLRLGDVPLGRGRRPRRGARRAPTSAAGDFVRWMKQVHRPGRPGRRRGRRRAAPRDRARRRTRAAARRGGLLRRRGLRERRANLARDWSVIRCGEGARHDPTSHRCCSIAVVGALLGPALVSATPAQGAARSRVVDVLRAYGDGPVVLRPGVDRRRPVRRAQGRPRHREGRFLLPVGAARAGRVTAAQEGVDSSGDCRRVRTYTIRYDRCPTPRARSSGCS